MRRSAPLGALQPLHGRGPALSAPRRTRLARPLRIRTTATGFDPGPIDRVGVVIPARNEAATITACLRSIDRAAVVAGTRVDVVVVADSCRDDTAHRARRATSQAATVRVIEGCWGGPSPARRAGVAHLLDGVGAMAARRWWVANTDADGVVACDWLQRQLSHARSGALAVAGIVQLDPGQTASAVFAAFAAAYRLEGATHGHVHAANFGLRADAYRAAGGWRERTMVGEDHHLGNDLAAIGVSVLHATDVTVTTSSRTAGRLPGGFATVLARLDVPA